MLIQDIHKLHVHCKSNYSKYTQYSNLKLKICIFNITQIQYLQIQHIQVTDLAFR